VRAIAGAQRIPLLRHGCGGTAARGLGVAAPAVDARHSPCSQALRCQHQGTPEGANPANDVAHNACLLVFGESMCQEGGASEGHLHSKHACQTPRAPAVGWWLCVCLSLSSGEVEHSGVWESTGTWCEASDRDGDAQRETERQRDRHIGFNEQASLHDTTCDARAGDPGRSKMHHANSSSGDGRPLARCTA